MQVGIRELKNKLTHYLEMAKRGHTVIITDRGAPVAVMHNLAQIEVEAGSEERLAYLAAQGLLSLPRSPDEPAFEPVERAEAKGGSVSETIIGDRR